MIITADFSGEKPTVTTESLYQWDIGQRLKICGLNNIDENTQVHFANVYMIRAIVKEGTYSDGELVVDIPNEVLQYGNATPVKAWVYINSDNDGRYTLRTAQIPVTPRKRPNDYVSPEDPDAQGIIEQAVELLENYERDITGKVSKPISSPNGTNGQLLRSLGDGNTEWVNAGLPTDAQTATAVSEWLAAHPEVTTSLQDGEVTNAKIGSGAVTASKLGADVNAWFGGKVSKPSTSPNGTNGQLLRTKGDGTTEWVDVGLPTDAQTAEAVSDWLDDHPEATTTVEDGAVTLNKLHSGVIDSTLSAQGAAAEAKTTGNYINVLTDRETALDGIVSQEWEIGMRYLVNGVETWSGTSTSRMSTKPGTYIRFNKDDLIVMKKTMDYQFLVVYSTDNGSTWTSTSNRDLPYSILEDSIGWICIKKTSGTFTEEEMQSVVNNYFFILRKGTGEIKKNALLAEALSIASGSFDRSEIIDSKYGFTYQNAKTTDTVVLSYDLLLPEFEASKGDIFAIKVSILIDYPDMYSNIGVRIYERYNGNTVKTTDITDISDTIIYTVSNSNADAIHIKGLLLADEGDITTRHNEIFDYKISVVKKLPGEIEELLTEAGDIWEV